MGRCCAVKGCQSGRKAWKNVRKVTLFKAPKDIEKRGKWSSAVDQELQVTNYICELHFDPEDVIKMNQEKLADGSIYIYEFQNVRLRKNAAPKSNATNNNSENKDSSLLDDATRISSDSIDDNMINDCCLNSVETISVDVVVDKVLESDNLNSATTDFIEHTNDTNTGIGDDNLATKNKPEELSFQSIQSIFESQPLRKYWSWTIIKKELIALSYINSKLELVCHIKIDRDLKVTIINAKTNIVIKKEVNILSIADVWQLLLSLENSFFCNGTGCDKQKCSQTCTGILSQDERYKRSVPEYRCISCRRLRLMIQKHNKRDTDYEDRVNMKHRYNLDRRKLNRVDQQNKKLKQELLHLKNQCAEIGEEVLATNIADLPALQQKKKNPLKRIMIIRKTGVKRIG